MTVQRRFWRATAGIVLAATGAACSNAPSSPSAPPPDSVFVTSTYRQGSLLYFQNATSTDTFRIALDTAWGSSIVELSLDGTNFVNAHDPGREVQIAFYDGNAKYDLCAGCTGVFGWNPVQSGDQHGHGAPTLAYTIGSDSLYAKVQPLQWYPDDKGGGPAQPVAGDILVEQTVTPVAKHAAAFHVHFMMTHLGADLHANSQQELPAVYANAEYSRFAYYGGGAPWTGAAASFTTFPHVGTAALPLYSTERWGAYVNAQNEGITVYAPSAYPYVTGFYNPGPGGPTGDGTNYFAPVTPLTIAPGFTMQGDYYVIAGDLTAARRVVYALHQADPAADIATPFGAVDAPAAGAALSGLTTVIGWAMDNVSVATVEVTVDGVVDGTATYGLSRPDVATAFPHAPVNVGFEYSLNSANYANGAHTVTVRVTDAAGNVAIFPDVAVTIAN
jgi:hypothetical protein